MQTILSYIHACHGGLIDTSLRHVAIAFVWGFQFDHQRTSEKSNVSERETFDNHETLQGNGNERFTRQLERDFAVGNREHGRRVIEHVDLVEMFVAFIHDVGHTGWFDLRVCICVCVCVCVFMYVEGYCICMCMHVCICGT